MTKSNEDSRKSSMRFPFNIDVENIKTIEKKVLEIDPNGIKVGEVVIITVPQWGGLKNECFAVMNVDGKHILVEQLRKKEKKEG